MNPQSGPGSVPLTHARTTPCRACCGEDALAGLVSVLQLYPRLPRHGPRGRARMDANIDALQLMRPVAQPGTMLVLARQARCPFVRDVFVGQDTATNGEEVIVGDLNSVRRTLTNTVLEEIDVLGYYAQSPIRTTRVQAAAARRAAELQAALQATLRPYMTTILITDA